MSNVLNGKGKYSFIFFLFAASFSICLLIYIHVNHKANIWDLQAGTKMKKH